MNLRPTAMMLAAAALASGCVVTPGYHETRHTTYEHRTYHADDAYEGYYYVRIVYFNGVPWYVDDDLHARPVPRHLHAHFRNTTWTRSLPPRFVDDDEVRDGYRVSRIVYINGAPHHVDDGRLVRPLPRTLRNRFTYRSVAVRPAVPVGRHAAPAVREMPSGRPGYTGDRGPDRDERRRGPDRADDYEGDGSRAYRDRDRYPMRDAGPMRGRDDDRGAGRMDERIEAGPSVRETRIERMREVRRADDAGPAYDQRPGPQRGDEPERYAPGYDREPVRVREQDRVQVRERDERGAPHGRARKGGQGDEDEARDDRGGDDRGNGRGRGNRRDD